MRYRPFMFLALMVGVIAFVGCEGIESTLRLGAAEDEEQVESLKPRKKKEFLEIREAYDLKSLLIPVLQYNNLVLSFDYFPQFIWDGDEIFPEYLHRIFGVERSPFRPGEGTVLTAGYEDTGTELIVERALLVREEDGAWWQVQQTYLGEPIVYEVFISRLGMPLRIRYNDPETGGVRESVPEYVEAYAILAAEDPDRSLESILEEERSRQIEKEWPYAFNQPEILGEELIETGAGQFMSVHVRDAYEDEYGTDVDYWISPGMPGSIVRIVYSSPGQPSYVVDLQELTTGNAPVLSKAGVVQGRGGSEGSPSKPVEVSIETPHPGHVGKGGTSYYRVRTNKRADLHIAVTGLRGQAELFSFGGDPAFHTWYASSSGSELSLDEYFVEPCMELYFTVVDLEDGGGEGERYTVTVEEEVFLSPVGIGMRGEIYHQARELKPGKSYSEALDIDGLSYYMTRVRRGRRLRITARELLPAVDLIWYEATNTSSASAYSVREEGTRFIEVRDVSPGTVCYFYLVGDPVEIPFGSLFVIKIEELSY